MLPIIFLLRTASADETQLFSLLNLSPIIDSKHFVYVNESNTGVAKSFVSRGTFSSSQNFAGLGLEQLQQADIGFGYSLGKTRIGWNVPIYLQSQGDILSESAGELKLGQVSADAKYSVFQKNGLGLGFLGRGSFPVGGGHELRSDLMIMEGETILDFHSEKIGLSLNLGYRYQNGEYFQQKGNSFPLYKRVGISAPIGKFGLSAEYTTGGQIGLRGLNTSNLVYEAHELLIGSWFQHKKRHYHLGFGSGLGEARVSPEWRVLFSVRHQNIGDEDEDGDGISDSVDICPAQAEDLDGFEDWDGCPEMNTQLLQTTDHVAGEAEKVSWVMETKASEGVISLKTETSKFETLINEEVEKNLKAQMETTDEAVLGSLKLVATDQEGNDVENAVWIIDGQQSALPNDAGIVVPLIRGQHDVVVRAEGYREFRKTILIEADEVKIIQLQMSEAMVLKGLDLPEKIFFKVGSHEIDERSHVLLNDVAEILLRHTLIELVHIEGHTDSGGKAEINKAISQARAEEVRDYLIEKGVEPSRLVAIGYGEEKPIDTNDTEEGRHNNRRVIFEIKKLHGETEAGEEADK